MLLWELLSRPRPDPRPSSEDQGEAPPCATRLPFETRCAAIARKGKRCRSRIHRGSEFCLFHDPALAEVRKQWALRPRNLRRNRLMQLPDGYLRRLKKPAAIGEAMDRLYREVRLGVVTPQMGKVLFDILTRVLDSGAGSQGTPPPATSRRRKADRIRPKLAELLSISERRAWRKAVDEALSAPGRSGVGLKAVGAAERPRPIAPPVATEAPARIALPAAS